MQFRLALLMVTLLPQSSECWDYERVPPCPARLVSFEQLRPNKGLGPLLGSADLPNTDHSESHAHFSETKIVFRQSLGFYILTRSLGDSEVRKGII